MSESTLVSVIVPVHNAGKYLEPCLASVLGQSLRAIEVIAVDDASTDGSADVLTAIADADDRLRVVSLSANQGVSAARNIGLAQARGEFVAFVDADDYVDAAMYADLVTAAHDLRSDVVSCGLQVENDQGENVALTPFPLPLGVRHDRTEMRERLHRAWADRLLWYPVRSVYRLELLTRHGVRFDEGVHKGEDSLFNLQALVHADGVACIRAAPYHYRKHGSSATARPLESESGNLINLACGVLGVYREQDFDERAESDFYQHVLRSDLPTALVRLGAHSRPVPEIRALITCAPVRKAFATQPVSQLGVPMRVSLLLLAARLRDPRFLALLLGLHNRGRVRSLAVGNRARGRRDKPRLALTYDDGPGERTAELLDILSQEQAAATFFLVGENAALRPDVVTRMAREPDVEIASHTMTHPDLTRSTPTVVDGEITRNAALIGELSGRSVLLFRPPWGRHDAVVRSTAADAGQSLILYGLDSGDWSHGSAGETVRRIAEAAVDGDIVLLHDTLDCTVEASRPLIRALRERGFKLVTVTELLGPTTAGRAYTGPISIRTRVSREVQRSLHLWRSRGSRVVRAAARKLPLPERLSARDV